MSHMEKYREFFTKDSLMGPNSLRLLDELLRKRPWELPFGRTLDLGCGKGLSSVFLAGETDAGQIFAFDLWIPATENLRRIRALRLEDRIIPVHGDALDMPFAHGYFDTVVSVDSYHYFGCREGVFAEKILPFVRSGGCVMIAVPGLREEPRGDMRELLEAWAEGEDAELFRTADWWRRLLHRDCADCCDIVVREGECTQRAWQDWFDSGHEYALRDREFLEKGLDRILNFVLIYARKKEEENA